MRAKFAKSVGILVVPWLVFSGCGTERRVAPERSLTKAMPARKMADSRPPSALPVIGAPAAVDEAGGPVRVDERDDAGERSDAGERYERILDNPFVRVADRPLSTFSIDVDTASYSKVRQYLIQYNQLPRPDAVRIEELLNYFHYQYEPPSDHDSHPFATRVSVAECPWNQSHRLARLAIQGRTFPQTQRPASNLVLLIDTSGSMKQANKLPLLKQGMGLLLEQLSDDDRIAIVAYAGSAGLVLDSTPASERSSIMAALDRLEAGGSTNGGAGLELAYAACRDHFLEGGINRVLVCTDGDFNVGPSGTDELLRMIENESQSGIELTVLGFGMGNLNDAMLEAISGRGNGNYAFIDTIGEAKKVLVEQLSGTLVTIAKDVKIQIEFNPAKVAAYRLIGYENRVLESEDFADDRKDAGEIGAGHSVTAFYELVPPGARSLDSLPEAAELRYQQPAEFSSATATDELMTVKLRYKQPGQDVSHLIEQVVRDRGTLFEESDREFQFAAAVAGFGMLLRDSEHRGDWSYDAVAEVAHSSLGEDPHGLRREFLDLIAVAQSLDTGEHRRVGDRH